MENTTAPTQPKFTVSQETLDLLNQGKASMLERRQEMLNVLQELEKKILQQEGGIMLMQTLLGEQSPTDA